MASILAGRAGEPTSAALEEGIGGRCSLPRNPEKRMAARPEQGAAGFLAV
jgi:hypothetical protein